MGRPRVVGPQAERGISGGCVPWGRGSPELARPRGAPVDPDAYTLRIVSSYETASSRYAWLNGALGVGHGTLHEGWLDLTVHEVL